MRTLYMGMSGTDVMEIQALLKKLGYYTGAIDGIFGQKMLQAVIRFQKNFGLKPDGIAGQNTYQAMEPYLLGYDRYSIRPGDTFYKIAKRYHTSLALLLAANPGFDPKELKAGQQIVVPYGIDVVDTNIDYTYEVMERDIEGLKARYPFIETGIAGKSVLEKNLYYIKLGTGPNQVFYNGAHHALEWITAPLLTKFAEEFSKAYAEARTMSGGYSPRSIWAQSSIYIIPMVNPDGVDLVLNGLQRDNPNYQNLLRWNKGSTDFSKDWEANNNGVDLNHNYNAAWEESKQAEAAYGITGPGPTRYSGAYPESEPESKTVADFTRSHNFRLALAYHTQGQVIYWNFMNMAPPEAETIGEAFAKDSGYTLDQATGIASYAGYKDWFTKEYRRPGYTIEAGLGNNPLPISQFDKIYRDNVKLLLHASVI